MDKMSEKILNYIAKKGQVSPNELAKNFAITYRAISKQIKNLLIKREIEKLGKSPKVFYSIKEKNSSSNVVYIEPSLKKIIDDNFMYITSSGKREDGFVGFSNWCEQRSLPVEKTAKEYKESIDKYFLYKKNGIIDGMYKMKKTFSEVFVDKLFYIDFYSIERFGKTKLGQILLYAKQSQDRKLIKELISYIKPKINALIKRYNIDAIGFVPPTVKREVQLMKELEAGLGIRVPILKLVKVKTPIIVPQKTLTKLDDRVENARNTIIFSENGIFNRILLVDDALGSGATINEIARKIKNINPNTTIIGLAITGSFSGFEIISEV